MSFFDERVPNAVKQNMVSALDNEGEDITSLCPKRNEINIKNTNLLCDKDMDHFITPQSMNLFDRFGIRKEFLSTDPSLWYENDDFIHGLEIVSKLRVINDCAERAVSLMEQYNNILTRNEDQKQFILQIITEFRQKYPDARKSTVSHDF